jgi:hypothetical protein
MVHVMLFPVLNVLYSYTSTFGSTCAVHNKAVLCSSLISYFPGMLHWYFLNDFEMVPVAPTIIGIALLLRIIIVSNKFSLFKVFNFII